MIVYEKDGKHFILMANSSRGVMELSAENLESYKAITAHTEVTGVPYETISALKNVQRLKKYDDGTALLLQGAAGSMDCALSRCPERPHEAGHHPDWARGAAGSAGGRGCRRFNPRDCRRLQVIGWKADTANSTSPTRRNSAIPTQLSAITEIPRSSTRSPA